ncbi:MAG: UbiH/UbiF/VisC/COQ6 family ubiquinone biosynthesis hydroxylase [Litoreibacter sp.]|nr:UbiH/UbiF/VisC/COQ6 family ubiquinone biosynthesis hydroxylase [Litoreibacter sp.]
MSFDSDITIVGGGLNGCALALALSSGGFTVSVIDSLPLDDLKAEFDGRSYALALASQRLLSAIGIWPALAENPQPILEIKVTDGRAGEGPSPFWMHFDHAEIEEGPMGFMVEDRHLRRAFLEAIERDPAITHLTPKTVVAQKIERGAAIVELSDGGTVTSRLIVGCDGRRSGTAERAGIGRSFKDYGQTALVAAIGHEKDHGGIAHQFFMPAGPLAILPLTGNRCSIVWAEEHGRAAELAAMNDDDFIAALNPAFGDFLGALNVAGARFSYPLNLTEAESLVAERLALVGDAAHGIHPIAGQGLNQGLRDAAALAEVLVDAMRRGEDIGAPDVLDRYAQWRRFDAKTLALATDMFNKLFSNDNPVLRLGRDLGMGVVNAMPGLRRSFIREAAGLTGDLPRLLKGRAL